MHRRYARSLRGERAEGDAPVNYGPNISVIGAIRLEGVVTAMTIEGAVDGEVFLAFTERMLAPELRPGDVVIMDNLAAHKVTGIREAIEAVGARLIYQPPYSPDLNPIEKCWAKIKHLLRSIGARTKKALYQALAQSLDLVTLQDLLGWFKFCGYGQAV
jgi:transposase